ncbi:uncharacterized protein LOC130820350 isoform X2 [Amaranthus tricolor]|uniref:uncharacterized protein LOC130820350 isoform X2 n=1 Tax=Amaranthus tricolor TaxID=29722 RepID=UPI002589609B|nr:uncharacterized protein LOC130820350 isoform X2 [Amaranthus tricolor]
MANSKLMTSRTYSGTFPGLDTPPGGEDDGPSIGIPKGWSSERVPRSSYRSRRHVGPTGLMPFSSGRTLPSKWEDAERWICSPVSLGNISTNSNYYYYGSGAGSRTVSQLAQYQRRAKSKSGPLGPIGPVYYGGGFNTFSPVLGVGVINGGRWRNSVTIESPGLASGRFDENLGVEGGGGSDGGRRSCPGDATHWLDSWSRPLSPTQGELNVNDEIIENINNDVELEQDHNCNGEQEPVVDRAISRRDMATEMFPDSQSSSPRSSAVSSTKSSLSMTSPCPFDQSNRDNINSSEYEIRDVQVDKHASATRSITENHSITSSTTSFEPDNKISKSQDKCLGKLAKG